MTDIFTDIFSVVTIIIVMFNMFENSYKGYQMWNAEDRYN